MENITLKKIAREAGVSVSTVSLALRGKGALSRERYQEIRDLAERMGYRPNPVLSSLASKRFSQSASMQAMTLAAVEFPVDGQSKQLAVFYRDPLREMADKLGYALQRFTSDDLGQYGNFFRTLYNRGAVGIVMTGQANAFIEETRPEWARFIGVQCGRFLGPALVNCVRPNIFQAVTMAFRELAARGYRRIGFGFGRHAFHLDDDDARYGAAFAMLRQQPDKDRVPPFEGRFDDDAGRVAWVRKHKPDAVVGFTAHDWYILRDAGFRIPEDLGFLALQLDRGHESDNLITGMMQQNDIIAEQSILLIDQLIRHNQRGIPKNPLETLVPSRWHEARSLRPRGG